MFIKLNEYIKPTQSLRKSWKGIVVDNQDPKKLGRVKCTIAGLLEGNKEILPWVFPRTKTDFGGSVSSSSFMVPNIDSELEIVFPFDDIYSPFYIGFWQSIKTHNPIFDDDYPDTYGFADETGNIFKVNKKQQLVSFTHSSGTKLDIDKDGNLTVTGTKNLTANITENAEINCVKAIVNSSGDTEINAGGDAKITASGNAQIDATQIQLNGSTGHVLTDVTDPFIDLITGAPTVGVPTVFAG